MGGCVASCFSCCDGCKRGPNEWQQRFMKKDFTQTVETASGEDFVVRRTHSSAKLGEQEFFDKFRTQGTMVNLIKEACAKYKGGSAPAMSYRPVNAVKPEDVGGKQLDCFHMGDARHISYTQLWNKIVGFANGLRGLGIQDGHKVALYEDTRYEWLVSCYGIWTAGATPVTVYANLGEEALVYALKESEVDTIVCNAKQANKLKDLTAKHGLKIVKIICIDDLPADVEVNETVMPWVSVVEAGLGKDQPEAAITHETLALLMYTSGTTGDPKGVMLTHGNVLAAINGINGRLLEVLDGAESPTYLGYLPLAHILEFCAENIMLINGFTVCYSNPRTLTNATARPHGDLHEFKPTFFAGVPRVFDGIRKVVESKLPPVGSVARTVFDRGFAERLASVKEGFTSPHWDAKVFANLAGILGGRCKWIISGGAPLSAKTQEWLTTVFGCYVGQGYGLTETGAACSVQRYWDFQTENTGSLLSCTEVKLRTVDEAYSVKNGKGEVLIRGAPVAQGYYKQPEKTTEAFLEDGWFATGDVGMFAPDGTLKIVGRTKALAKTSQGEYIAMEALESMYVQNDLILANGICIIVDSHQPFIVAVALTDEAKAMAFAAENKLKGDFPAILATPEFRAAAQKSLAATAKANGKKGPEVVKSVTLLAEEWTPENDVLTAAMKLKRRVIDVKYKAQIESMIAEHAEKH